MSALLFLLCTAGAGDAIRLYEEGLLPKARVALEVVVGDPHAPAAERELAGQYLVATLLELGETEAASNLCDSLLHEFPRVQFDPARFAPEVVRLVAERRTLVPAAAPAEPPAAVSLVTSPAPLPRSLPWGALGPALAGVACVVLGSVLWGQSNSRVYALNNSLTNVVGADPQGFAQAARVERVTGVAFVVLGIAAVEAALIWWILASRE